MQTLSQITFRHMDSSEALEKIIRKKIEQLDTFFDGIIGCHVTVEVPHRHHHQGKHFHVHIDLKVPGEEIIVNRDPAADSSHENPHAAVEDAFKAATRQLQDYVRCKRDR